MAKALSEIRDDIQELELKQKRELLGLLVTELESSGNQDFEEVWLIEAQRRFQQLKDGEVQGIPANQVFAKLNQQIG